MNNKLGMEMLLLSNKKILTAQECYDKNIINDIASDYDSMINELIPNKYGAIVEKSSICQSLGKQTFYQQNEQMNINDAYNIAAKTMVQNMRCHDAKEGIQSFLEKREPQWTNQ